MGAQRMSLGQLWMVKVSMRIARQAQPFHHAARTKIARNGEGDDFSQPEITEGMAQHLSRTFGRQTLSPVVLRQPPANFDTGCERSGEFGNGKPDETGQESALSDLSREEPKAMMLKVAFHALHHSVGLCGRHQPGHELHYERVGIYAAKRLAVRVLPTAQSQPFCCEGLPQHIPKATTGDNGIPGMEFSRCALEQLGAIFEIV